MECKKYPRTAVRSVKPTILLHVCELSFLVWVGFPERSRGAREGAKNPRNNVRPDDCRRIKAVSFEIRGVRFLRCLENLVPRDCFLKVCIYTVKI